MTSTTDTTSTAFSSLPLTPAFLANLDSLGYHEMTTIQAQSLPAVLDGRDLITQAKTDRGVQITFRNMETKTFSNQAQTDHQVMPFLPMRLSRKKNVT